MELGALQTVEMAGTRDGWLFRRPAGTIIIEVLIKTHFKTVHSPFRIGTCKPTKLGLFWSVGTILSVCLFAESTLDCLLLSDRIND